MRTYQATGIVLHRSLLGEADKILTLYSREHGKISAVAKGVRKPGSRNSGATELFTYSRFLLSKGRTLDVVSQCEIINSFPGLRTELERLARATYVCELLDRITTLHDADGCGDIHDITVGTLAQLQHADSYPDGILHAYEMHLLSAVGYAPELERCVRCGNTVSNVSAAFSALHGGVLCREHRHVSRDSIVLSAEAARAMLDLRDQDPDALLLFRVSERVGNEIARALRVYINTHLERSLKSAEFLDQLRTT